MTEADPVALTEDLTRKLWPSFKRQLAARFPGEDHWIRPMYLFRAMRANAVQVHLLAALPPSGRIISTALTRLPAMRELLAPSFNISLTRYPDQYQVDQARQRYGIDIAPPTWARRGTA